MRLQHQRELVPLKGGGDAFGNGVVGVRAKDPITSGLGGGGGGSPGGRPEVIGTVERGGEAAADADGQVDFPGCVEKRLAHGQSQVRPNPLELS